MTVRKHVLVSGRVQGVFYRASAREAAHRLGVTGWIRNRGDGRVEAEFQGPAEAVESMVAFCHEGSDQSRVDHVEVSDVDSVDGESRFAVQ